MRLTATLVYRLAIRRVRTILLERVHPPPTTNPTIPVNCRRSSGAFAHSIPFNNILSSHERKFSATTTTTTTTTSSTTGKPLTPPPITAPDFYRDLYYRVDVIFHDKTVPNDPGFTLPLSYRNMYDDMARAVGAHLNCDPYMIQFFKPQGTRMREGG